MEQKYEMFGHDLMNHTDGSACIIAEAGINHDGNVKKGKQLIDAATRANCTCVKFQAFKTEKVTSRYAIGSSYMKQGSKDNETAYDLSKRLELNFNQQRTLFEHAANKGIPWIASFFDDQSLSFLVELGVPVLKVASALITDFPLLKQAAETGMPLIVSTGMASIDEIDRAVSFLKNHDAENLYLMHCVSWYPADIDEMNIRVIDTLFNRYKIPVGLSDHTLGISVSCAARARGVKLFEKHFTLSQKNFGPDHGASIEPDELAKMVSSIDEVGRCLGSAEKRVTPIEIEQRKVFRKSLVASRAITPGTILTRDHLATKRPGLGIAPQYMDEIVGYTALREIHEDDVIQWDMIQSPSDNRIPPINHSENSDIPEP